MSSNFSASPLLQKVFERPVTDLLKTPPILLQPVDKLEKAIDVMRARHRGCVLVVNADKRLCGVFTERDAVIKLSVDDSSWRAWTLGDCMTPAPQTISETTTIGEALNKMNEGRFRHIPVVDVEGRVLGIVSIRDILGLVVEMHPQQLGAGSSPQ